MTAVPVIAIDGPGGSGKSTVARAVAARLGYRHLDTGAMYRAVTVLVLRAGVAGDSAEAAQLAQSMTLELGRSVLLNGEDVTAAIRALEVDEAVSSVAANPAVRANLVARQRAWLDGGRGAVVEGRDIGSVVFPDAALKVYLTADPRERARRRLQQVGEWDPGRESVPVEEASALLSARDDLDATRSSSPLVVPDGAKVVDSTGRSVEDVVEEVLSYL
ncbi:MAG: (d)CMP kinase [Actinomycetota bacterium]|nr:(d)CMP kinase [Actinomycetota bacterium]